MNKSELLWAMLPEGLEEYFELISFHKTDKCFQIELIEKNNISEETPKEHQGKKIINSVLNQLTIDDFPIRGRKCELIIKRRSWKFEGVDKWYKRDIKIRGISTKLSQEFALF